jgi:hypothetical protein
MIVTYLASIPASVLGMCAYKKVSQGHVTLLNFMVIGLISIIPFVNTLMTLVSVAAAVAYYILEELFAFWEKNAHRFDLNKRLF